MTNPAARPTTEWFEGLSRREALRLGLLAGGAAALGARALAQTPATPGATPGAPSPGPSAEPGVPKADKPLQVLVLGGTIFLGPPTVERLLARGHSVTLFNRGKSNPQLFPDLEKLRGNRSGDLASLKAELDKGRTWDAVIDTSAYLPADMRASTTLLSKAVKHYVLVATVNVYRDDQLLDQDETGPVHEQWNDTGEITPEQYGPMKRGCEVELEKLMPGRSCSVRPALIAGPRDPSDRFSYWPVRALRGGRMLAPVSPHEPTQVIDARDLGAFMVHLAETRATGAFNALGLPGLTIGAVIDASIAAARKAGGAEGAQPVYAPLEFLAGNNVQAWADLPAWVPSQEAQIAGMPRRVGKRALDAGLKPRPIQETCAGVLEWWARLPEARRAKLRAGLSAKREEELLALLDKR